MRPFTTWSWYSRSGRQRRILFLSLTVLLVSGHLDAFLIPVHRQITENALLPFPQAEISAWERTAIIRGCTDADLVEGDLPITRGPYEKRFHFDNDFSYEAVMDNYAAVARLIDRNLSRKERDPWEFGKMLHSIEDFYSHSNYVWLYRDYVAQSGNELVGSIPTLEEVSLDAKTYKGFIAMLRKDLHTGRYPLPKWHFVPTDTDHGYVIGPGMNKDSLQRPLFADARETATRAASWYLRLYVGKKEARKKWIALKSTGLYSGAR